MALLFCTFTRASIFLLRFFVFVFWRRESLFFQELNSPRPPFFFFFNCRRTGPSHLTPQQSRREKERSHVDPRAEPVPRRHHQEQAQEPGLTGFFCARLVSQPTPKRLNNTEARWCCRCCRQGSCLATQEEGRTWYVFRPPRVVYLTESRNFLLHSCRQGCCDARKRGSREGVHIKIYQQLHRGSSPTIPIFLRPPFF